ncbi:aminodeoxychorismate synthase component I [Desulfobulbus alkaliphilus]|uniref:aminodeoxychorismate synthase component I n=1 Tax=Desulfobulbus alkaliphilus TaxID=869814 RepID=UPI001964B20C|nr:aminodeoxychorismate synthase component I [Desulfobulbus alkaliphilus]MBM9535625.1 aminodeoxychorismate synthase component I [Desulfobulbus alkaliphilus]
MIVLRDQDSGRWLHFSRPRHVVVAHRTEEVAACLEEIDLLVRNRGWAAAGFLAYEAAPALDPALEVFSDQDHFPLLWFGLYPPPEPVDLEKSGMPLPELAWTATVSKEQYTGAIARIQALIAAGDTYQVNYTYRLHAPYKEIGATWPLFTQLARDHAPAYGGYLEIPDWTILSLSPELFFRLHGERIESIPMKGTIGRAPITADDREQGQHLRDSGKDRAENVMIVDMVRNDLSRIAEPGSVRVRELFAVERHPTLWQMVSPVQARTHTHTSFQEICTALFPAASITGAPKARTMAIISELEAGPRRIYTGAIGFFLPDRRAQFNVAIRTLLLDHRGGRFEYGVGGGITADSTAEGEWEETRLKSLVCRTRPPQFSLLETLLWTPQQGYLFLAEHVRRMQASAEYFSRPFDPDLLRARLTTEAREFARVPQRVRVLLDRDGGLEIEATPSTPHDHGRPVRLVPAPCPIDDTDVFLYHKTTRREVYERMRAALPPEADDVLLYNRRGEITETTIANIVVTIDGRDYTPPVHCGLLAGTHRQHLLDGGRLEERVLTLEDLSGAERFALINSVRGRYPAVLLAGRLSVRPA